MNGFTRFVIASDFLATSSMEQDGNLRWLKDMFSRPVGTGAGLVVSIASHTWNKEYNFKRSEFFSRSGMKVDLEETQIFFEATQVSETSIEYLATHFKKDWLIFGYEMSDATRTVIDRAGLTYIDMWLHPVRYMDDILFAFRSNNDELNERLQQFESPEELCYVYADRLRIQNYRGYRKFKNVLRTNSALFVGQTLKDKAIASSRGMLTVADFPKQFAAIAAEHSQVYYSRHPFVKSGDEKVLAFVRGYRNVSLTEQPAYHMLATDELERVFSVSSSVVTEAKYFGKKAEYLFKPPVRVYAEAAYTSLLHVFLFSNFWKYIMTGGSMPHWRTVSFIDGRNKLRDALSWYWGFRQIDRLEGLQTSVANLLSKKGS